MVLCLMDSTQGAVASIILGYDEASLGDWLQPFRDHVVVLSFGVGMSKKNGYNHFFLQSSVFLIESLFTCGVVQFYE
jgi:hypothetical protein